MEPLRLVTINTGKCDGPYRARISWLVEEVSKLRPDVLACQEVFREAEGDRDSLEALGRGLGMHAAWAPARFKQRCSEGDPVEGWSGMALFSRRPWTYVDVVDLPSDPRDGDRVAQVGLLEIEQGSVVIANVHLTHLRDADELRRRQIRAVLSHPLLGMRQALRVVCGDLNSPSDGVFMTQLLNAEDAPHLLDCYLAGQGELDRATLPPRAELATRPCVDYILSVADAPQQHPIFASSAVVLKTPDPTTGALPSDHYGVATTLMPLRIQSWRQEHSFV